jgi:hypothetical protein
MSTIKTTVYLDEADYRALQDRAALEGRATAELIREAVRAFATQHTATARYVAEATPRYQARRSVEPTASTPLPSIADRLAEIQAIVREIPPLDTRTADEIIGYDDRGLPT